MSFAFKARCDQNSWNLISPIECDIIDTRNRQKELIVYTLEMEYIINIPFSSTCVEYPWQNDEQEDIFWTNSTTWVTPLNIYR